MLPREHGTGAGKVRVALLFLALALTALPADARIKRSQSAKVAFKLAHPCPATGATKGPCSGWVIDHVNPLSCGGPDTPENMQWQTVAEGKAKDRVERAGCTATVK